MSFKMGESEDEEIMAEINMTPLIDIMLVLLIIFMVSSSISMDSGLDIDLPEAKSRGEGKPDAAVIVSLDTEGNISVQGEQLGEADLGETIAAALKKENASLVILEGDKASKLGNAVEIMDTAKAAGAEKFAIAAEPE